MIPSPYGSSRNEASDKAGDSSLPRKRLKISNLLNSPQPPESELQVPEYQWVLNNTVGFHISNNLDFDFDDLLEAAEPTPGLVDSPLHDVCYGMVRFVVFSLHGLMR
jgi:hypothetical protein